MSFVVEFRQDDGAALHVNFEIEAEPELLLRRSPSGKVLSDASGGSR